jgi:4-hydroxybenzoate polyprenyltransferase
LRRALDPLVIFKGESIQQQWFPHELNTFQCWKFAASSKGWTDDEIALYWLREIFLPQTKPSDLSYCLLILDGHGSYTTDDFMYEYLIHRVFIVFLPLHSSYMLQLLDLAVFGPVKTKYKNKVSAFIDSSDISPIGKIMFLYYYKKARDVSLTSSNIVSGWKASRLWLICPRKPLNHRLVL